MDSDTLAAMARLQGADIIVNNPGIPSAGAGSGDLTLRAFAASRGIPGITVEYGDPQIYQPDMTARGLRGIQRTMAYLKMTQNPVAAWVTIITMDVWHWTSLVVLLSYAGLVSIPDAYYQAAKIDGASNWSVFRYIQLPKMKNVLTIAILLRFMDSFNIYTEPFVLTGGGPGNSTTLLSIDLVKIALGQFDLGPAAAMSLIYFAITLLVSWLFYTLMTKDDAR